MCGDDHTTSIIFTITLNFCVKTYPTDALIMTMSVMDRFDMTL